MNGVLVVDKPAGPTSHDVVAKARSALKEKKVGHTGTLDPVATGVLPLVIGSATKLARYITGGDKTYQATIRLGVTTTTLDAEGATTAENPVDVTDGQVREVLARFVGEIDQIPPMYSAKKVEGRKLYELARKGVEVAREPKKVRIDAVDLVSCDLPDVTVTVRCSAGTYVRVLAKDVGDALGCGGHLRRLRRLAAGAFTLSDAVALDDVVSDPDSARTRIVPVSRALQGLPHIDVPPGIGRMVASGYQLTVADLRTLDVPDLAVDGIVVLREDGGEAIAVARVAIATADLPRSRRDERALRTERVLGSR